MSTIFFFMFCFGNAYLIYWCLRNDDQAKFQGQKRDKKFTPVKKKNNENIKPDL